MPFFHHSLQGSSGIDGRCERPDSDREGSTERLHSPGGSPQQTKGIQARETGQATAAAPAHRHGSPGEYTEGTEVSNMHCSHYNVCSVLLHY